MESLTAIANRHGTDKGTVGPTPGTRCHNYTDFYEAYLRSLRSTEINLLEIGLGVCGQHWPTASYWGANHGAGGSLRMWYDYFPRARIFGLDVNPASHLDNDRTRTFVADQGNVRELEAFMGEVGELSFDVVVDDGSHLPHHQQVALSFFFPRLKKGGFYFIEDLLENDGGTHTNPSTASNGASAEAVLNTRKVVRAFLEDGKFAAPNALSDPQGLAEQIDYGGLHAPTETLTLARGKIRHLRPIRRVQKYNPGSESLCMLRKR